MKPPSEVVVSVCPVCRQLNGVARASQKGTLRGRCGDCNLLGNEVVILRYMLREEAMRRVARVVSPLRAAKMAARAR